MIMGHSLSSQDYVQRQARNSHRAGTFENASVVVEGSPTHQKREEKKKKNPFNTE